MKKLIIFCSIFLIFISCTKVVYFEKINQKKTALKTSSNTIILHDDYIFADIKAHDLKQRLIKKIMQKSNQHQKFKFIHLKSGAVLPANKTNRPVILLIGNIWQNDGQTRGKETIKVLRTKTNFRTIKKWDELEKHSWKQDQLQVMISFDFIELSEETKLLKEALIVSNDKKYILKADYKTIISRQSSKFYQDPHITPGYKIIKLKSDLNNQTTAINEIVNKTVEQIF